MYSQPGPNRRRSPNLSAQQLFPLKIDLADTAKQEQKFVGRRVRARALAIFYGQLSDLLKSGVPLLRSLELLEKQATSPALQLVVRDVKEHVADGSRLYDAMRRHPKVFSELVISMVRAGEEGGFLEEVLKRIAAFTDHQEDLKGRVIGAMVYPAFLATFGTIIVAVLLVKFVPKFDPIFSRMDEQGELPWATTTLLAMSDFAQRYYLIAIVALIAAGWGLHYWMNTPGRTTDGGPLPPQALWPRTHCEEPRHRPFLPHPRDTAQERRPNPAVPQDRQGRHRQRRPRQRDRVRVREHLRRASRSPNRSGRATSSRRRSSR